jgi:hypothetical protein
MDGKGDCLLDTRLEMRYAWVMKDLAILWGLQILTRRVGALRCVTDNMRVEEVLGGFFASHFTGMLGGRL